MKNLKNIKDIKDKIIVGISAILLIIALLINKAVSIRPTLAIICCLIITYYSYTKLKSKKMLIPAFLICLLITIIIDSSVSLIFNRIPIYSYNIVSNDKTRVYNGIGLIVWQCDKNNYKDLITKPFTDKSYMCDIDGVAAIDSNSFLNSVVENYNDYKNKYIKIKGKISKKSSQTYIEMQPYEETDVVANGYVNFADNITLRILFAESEESLDLYDIYDEITVIGVIKNLDKSDGKYIIYMNDSKIAGEIDTEITSIDTIPSQSCSGTDKIIYSSEEYKIQTYCTEDVFVTYNSTKYEIANALSSNKLTLTDLIDQLEESENDKGIVYKAENYSVLKCNDTNTYIVSNKDENYKNATCDLKE